MPDPDPDLEIFTPASLPELEPFRRIISQSMIIASGPGNQPDPVEPESDWLAREGLENLRFVRSAKGLLGGLSVQRLGQWFGGKSVPTGAVRAVAIAPEARSRGVARTMLRRSLEELHAAGIPLSTLYPATQILYRRLGYELAGTRRTYRLPLAGLRLPGAELELVETALTPFDPFIEPYRERAAAANGMLDRNPWQWQRVLDRFAASKLHAYLARRDGRIEGYLVYSQNRIPGTMRGEIALSDLVANTTAALRTLLRFLAEHRSIVDTVSWRGAPVEPLFTLLDNPTYTVDTRWDWMLRLVDVEGALASRGYSEAVSGEVELAVEDDVLGWNNGRYVLAVDRGKAEVRQGGGGRLRLDVRGLAAAYTGYFGPGELVAAGYAAGPAGDLRRLAALFAGPMPWMPDFF